MRRAALIVGSGISAELIPSVLEIVEAAGVETDKRGFITVDDQLATSVPGIWAIGDANGKGAFTPTSYNDYEILAANMFDDDPRRVSDRITTYGFFIDPPLGRAGMTETQVRDSGRKALVGKMQMARVGRAKERSETQGFMKILIDAETKRILGASLLGICGDEIIHSLLDAMYADGPVHGDPARHAHSSHGYRADPDNVGRLAAVELESVARANVLPRSRFGWRHWQLRTP